MATVRPRHRNSIALQHVNRGEGGGERKTIALYTHAFTLQCVFYLCVCEIVSVFDRQYRVIGLGTVPKLPAPAHGRALLIYKYNTYRRA